MPQLVIENGVLCRRCKQSPSDPIKNVPIIPGDQQHAIIRSYHDSKICGHLGIEKTLGRLLNTCYWPGIRQSVVEYISNCTSCQEVKSKAIKNPNQVVTSAATFPGELVTADVLKLPSDQGYNCVLLIVDAFSKYPVAYKLRNETAQSLLKCFIHYFTHFGIPHSLLTDQGTNFESYLVAELLSKFEVIKFRTNPYHPQTDGETERMNRSLLEMLRHYAENGKWVDNLDLVLMAYRTAINKTTGVTPCVLFFGREMKSLRTLVEKCPDIMGDLQKAELLDTVEMNKIRQHSEEITPLKEGQQVLLRHFTGHKLQPKFQSGWIVSRQLGKSVEINRLGKIRRVNIGDLAL